ncbi:MAG: ATP-binding cassette domain-containing protein [Proteobacteria bacterium]|nr:ATP-binding cassette domain-containing protein [Pseudomonadota bacterium]
MQSDTNKILKLKNIKKAYYDSDVPVEVLHGADIEIGRGSITAIVGTSGAGKSTLLHIMGFLDKPDDGEIVYKNRFIQGVDDDKLSEIRNREFGFVFQFHHLLTEFTALENVMIPLLIQRVDKKAAAERSRTLLDEMGILSRENHKPAQLSGGERQRVAIARALVIEPTIVFADEPTGNLDRKTSENVMNIMVRILKEREISFVIVTHNRLIEKYADKTVYLIDGKVENHYDIGIDNET